ncbi:MAG: AraC family transcriptional regulator [Cyanobacteria bacterium P01_A01_bin.40]
MKTKSAQLTVSTSRSPGILIEKYSYSAGAVEPLPKHSHQEYQLGMSFNCEGEYFYRGAYHPVPIGKLSIIHSGEVHSPSERTYLPQPASFLMMHIDSILVAETALEINNSASVPFFTEPILGDRILIKLFYDLCLVTETNSTNLTRDSLILDFLSRLITQNQEPLPTLERAEKPVISHVCDYLQANYQENISLAKLANIAGISRFYLSRLFRREKGISLSAYQTQIKIDRAKQLLSQGMPIATVATATGFYDQSHFGYHFKRLVGTTPRNYRKEQ